MKIISKRGRQAGHLNARFTGEQVNALHLCHADPVHFINKYIQIDDLLRGSIPFKLYPYQEEYVRFLVKNPQVVAVMPRQAGTTSVTIGLLIWDAIFHSDRLVVVGGSNLGCAQHLCQILNSMAMSVPAWLRPTITHVSRTSLQFSNGSRILIGITSTGLLHGRSASRVYLDNFAHSTPRAQHEAFLTLIPCLTARGTVTIASTPNGVSNMFAKLYYDSMNGTSPAFVPFKKTVNDMTQYDDQWKQSIKSSIGPAAWSREFECEFN